MTWGHLTASTNAPTAQLLCPSPLLPPSPFYMINSTNIVLRLSSSSSPLSLSFFLCPSLSLLLSHCYIYSCHHTGSTASSIIHAIPLNHHAVHHHHHRHPLLTASASALSSPRPSPLVLSRPCPLSNGCIYWRKPGGRSVSVDFCDPHTSLSLSLSRLPRSGIEPIPIGFLGSSSCLPYAVNQLDSSLHLTTDTFNLSSSSVLSRRHYG